MDTPSFAETRILDLEARLDTASLDRSELTTTALELRAENSKLRIELSDAITTIQALKADLQARNAGPMDIDDFLIEILTRRGISDRIADHVADLATQEVERAVERAVEEQINNLEIDMCEVEAAVERAVEDALNNVRISFR